MPNLVPVDNDPFGAPQAAAPQLVPVDHDPFAGAPAPDDGTQLFVHGKPVVDAMRAPNMGIGPDFVSGVGYGLRRALAGGGQLVSRGVEAIAPAGSGLEAAARAERERVETGQASRDAARAQARTELGVADKPDRGATVGQMLAAVPLGYAAGPSILGNMAAGAGNAALGYVDNPADLKDAGSFFLRKGKDAATSAATAGTFTAASKLVSPSARPQIQELRDRGVAPTPGQMIGGPAASFEEKLTSVPVVGDFIKSGQRRAVMDFNRGAVNDALAPIGEKLDMKTPLGREAVSEMNRKIGNAYEAVLPKLQATTDATFDAEMTNLKSLASNMLPERAKQLDTILQNELFRRINPQTNTMTGASLKEAESGLGGLARKYEGSTSGDEQLLGDALKEAQASLRRLVERSNPQAGSELAAVNRAYATALRVEKASVAAGSKEGVFTPNALDTAARQMDSRLNKRNFSEGKALTQPYAEAGINVLGSRVPDSGTAGRLAAGAALPAAVGAGAYAAANPVLGAMTAAGLGVPLLAYTPAGQRLFAAMLTPRPGMAGASQTLRALGTTLSAPRVGAGLLGGP